MPNLGIPELLLLLALVVLVFGSTRLPALGKGLGEGIRNFKRGLRHDEDEQSSAPRKP